MFRFLFSLLILATIPCKVLLSQNVDSLLNELNRKKEPEARAFTLAKLSFAISLRKPDSGMVLAKQGLELINASKNTEALANCYLSLGWNLFKTDHIDSSKYYLRRSAEVFDAIGLFTDEAKALLNLSSVCQSKNQYDETLQCLLKALELNKNSGSKSIQGFIERMLGITYREQGVYDKAKMHLFSALLIFKNIPDNVRTSDAAGSLGSLFFQQGAADSALFYYRLSASLLDKDNNVQSMGISYENLGDGFGLKGDQTKNDRWFDSSLTYYQKALVTFLTLGSRFDVAYEKMKIGKAYNSLKKYAEAIPFLLDAFHLFDSSKDYSNSFATLDYLSNAYKGAGDYKKASESYEKMIEYNDTINTRNKNDAIASMLAKYETEKKDREIELLNIKNNLSSKEVNRFKLIGLFSMICLGLAIVLVISLLNRYRIKQQLKEARVRNQLAADLHDDVGSTLSSILLLSKMAQENTSPDSQKLILNKISNNAKEIIEKTGEIVWTINARFDEVKSLVDKIEAYIEDIKQVSGINIRFNYPEDAGALKLEMKLRKDIFLILKEAINNIIKHAEAKNINIDLSVTEKQISLRIQDDGKGFDISQASATGNGLNTMIERAISNGGTGEVTSSPGNGTTVSVFIPHIRYNH